MYVEVGWGWDRESKIDRERGKGDVLVLDLGYGYGLVTYGYRGFQVLLDCGWLAGYLPTYLL